MRHDFNRKEISDAYARSYPKLPPEAQRRLTELPLPPRCVCISDDATLLACYDGFDKNLIRIWDCRTNRFVSRLTGSSPAGVTPYGGLHPDGTYIDRVAIDILKISFSPDNSLLAFTELVHGTVQVHVSEVATGQAIATLPGVCIFQKINGGKRWTKDSRFLVTRGPTLTGQKDPGEAMLFLQNHLTHSQMWEVAYPTPTYLAGTIPQRLQFSPDGTRLVMNDNVVWDVVQSQDRCLLRAHPLGAPGNVLLVTGKQLWATTLPTSEKYLRAIALYPLSPERTEVLLPFTDYPHRGAFPFYRDLSRRSTAPHRPQDKAVQVKDVLLPRADLLTLSPNERHLLATVNIRIDEWGLQTTREAGLVLSLLGLRGWPEHQGPLQMTVALLAHPDGPAKLSQRLRRRLPGANVNVGDPRYLTETLELWDVAERRHLAVMNLPGVLDYQFSPTGKYFATYGTKGLKIWEVAATAELKTVPWNPEFNSLDFPPSRSPSLPNGEQAAIDVGFKKPGRVFLGNSLAWSSDGERLLICHNGNAAVFERTDEEVEAHRHVPTRYNWRKVSGWKSEEKIWLSFAFSPDGRMVVSGGGDDLIRVWDADTGHELARWQAHKSNVTALAFSHDGKLLVSGSRDGTIKLWNLPYIRKELAALGMDWDE